MSARKKDALYNEALNGENSMDKDYFPKNKKTVFVPNAALFFLSEFAFADKSLDSTSRAC